LAVHIDLGVARVGVDPRLPDVDEDGVVVASDQFEHAHTFPDHSLWPDYVDPRGGTSGDLSLGTGRPSSAPESGDPGAAFGVVNPFCAAAREGRCRAPNVLQEDLFGA